MLNKQKPKLISLSNEQLSVHSIFETIQGEGPFAGVPALFLRLAGCNIQCPGCDTEYTEGAFFAPVQAIVEEVRERLSKGASKLLVITGGEPLRQAQALVRFINLFHGSPVKGMMSFPIQIETNGTLPLWTAEERKPLASFGSELNLHIVVSPKGPLHPFFDQWYSNFVQFHFKYVVQAGHIDVDGLPTRVLERKAYPGRPRPYDGPLETPIVPAIWVQPMDEQDPIKNAENAEAAASVCLKHGYRLTMQLHKLVNLP